MQVSNSDGPSYDRELYSGKKLARFALVVVRNFSRFVIPLER
jgi:hypothetical protein